MQTTVPISCKRDFGGITQIIAYKEQTVILKWQEYRRFGAVISVIIYFFFWKYFEASLLKSVKKRTR